MREIALFSTWDKEGLTTIARALSAAGLECVATGNTRTLLEKDGLKVTDISELTGEPERFGGRIKTLHHRVFGGLLFRPGKDESEWPEGIRVKALVCNFYPFVEKAKESKTIDEMIEWVDIGGPSMVRAAAKNHKHVWVFTRKDQYARVIAEPGAFTDPERGLRLRERLALEAFEGVAELDEAIARQFKWRHMGESQGGGALTYGENPHQPAHFVANPHTGLKFEGPLSYNNIRDAEAAFRFVSAFAAPAVSVIKHQTLCGAAAGLLTSDVNKVFEWAWEGDAVSRFGGIIGLNFVPSREICDVLRAKFLEVIVMPRTEESEKIASELHAAKAKLRFVLVEPAAYARALRGESSDESIQGFLGKLTQKPDFMEFDPELDTRDVARHFHRFGQWAASCSKSNAMILAGHDETTGVSYLAGTGQGQPNRLDSLRRLAVPRAQEFASRMKVPMSDLTCFSDAFLSHTDSLTVLHEAGVRRLVQPGGSKADDAVTNGARELGIDMQITGCRHFWH